MKIRDSIYTFKLDRKNLKILVKYITTIEEIKNICLMHNKYSKVGI